MPKKRIVLDIATIYPGKGGAGGGIWSYARNLLLHLDGHEEAKDFDFVCLVNKEFGLQLTNVKTKVLPYNFQNFVVRFLYIHFYLPAYVASKKALLHKVYFEVPFYLPADLLVTIHDCMMNFYEEKGYGTKSGGQRLKSWYFKRMNERAIRQSRLICTPSHSVKEEIIKDYRVPSQKIVVTPLASNTAAGQAKAKKTASAAVNLYCIAAFHRHKGHSRLIDIFEALVTEHGFDGHLYLRGHVQDASYFGELKAKVDASPARDRLHFVAFEEQTTLEAIYQKADWVVLLSEYEGFGLPVIEAQKHGVPVICSDIPTFQEVAGGSAFYIKQNHTTAEAAERLLQILTDQNKKEELTQKGFSNADKYSWEKFTGQMIDIYRASLQ